MARPDPLPDGLPPAEGPLRHRSRHREERGAGRPEVDLVQGRPLSELVAERQFSAWDEAMEEARPPGRAPHDPGHAPSVGGLGLRPGLRQPSGPTGRVPGDELSSVTRFRTAWGTPPDSAYFEFNPERRVYEPRFPRRDVRGVDPAQDQYDEAVHAHHLSLARRHVFLQPYRQGSGPWRYRWVRIPEAWGPYEVVGQGYDALGYSGPSRSDLAQERRRREQAAKEQGKERLFEDLMPGVGTTPRWQQGTSPGMQWVFFYYGHGAGGKTWEVKQVPVGERLPAGSVVLTRPPTQAVLEGRELPPEVLGKETS